MLLKRCIDCGAEKPLDAFPLRSRKSERRRSHCRLCNTARVRRSRQANPERARATRNAYASRRPDVIKSCYLKRQYGITIADYEALRAKQGGICAICPDGAGEVLHVDHDHVTGEVRGLLCGNCNRMLGCARDNPAFLAAGAAYLAKTPSSKLAS